MREDTDPVCAVYSLLCELHRLPSREYCRLTCASMADCHQGSHLRSAYDMSPASRKRTKKTFDAAVRFSPSAPDLSEMSMTFGLVLSSTEVRGL